MPQHLPFDLPDFTGWTLDEARAALSDPDLFDSPQGIEISVVETAPPVRPAREGNARPARKTKPGDLARATRPITNWGQWRVLRCATSESNATSEATTRVVELLVAREELAPQVIESSNKIELSTQESSSQESSN